MATKHSKSTISSPIIFRDILSRLPVKSLVRFKSVSKSWSSLIRSSSFAAAQIRRSSRRGRLLLRLYHQPSADCAISLLRDNSPTRRQLAVPFLDDTSRFPKIVGSCNGLILLDFSDCFSTDLVVWNPATRRFRGLPVRSSTRSPRLWRSAVGFGYSPELDDFRVLRVLYFQQRSEELPNSLVESFSLRSGCWTEVLPLETETSWVIQEPHVAVNAMGALHWVGIGLGESAFQGRFIVSFDLADEMFREVRLPAPYGSRRNENCTKVMAYEDTIALAVYPQLEDSGNKFEFWVMRKNGWFRQSVIQPFGRVYVPVSAWRGSDVVVMKLDDDQCSLISFDTIDERIENLYFSVSRCVVDVFNYVESIVSVCEEEDGRNGKACVGELPLRL